MRSIAFSARCARLVLGHALGAKADLDIGEHREPRETARTFWNTIATPVHGPGDGAPPEIGHLAFRGKREADDDAQQRGLAAAGAPEQADDLAFDVSLKET